jgi:pimeloyl-ACP methyl ester carboxylesterase
MNTPPPRLRRAYFECRHGQLHVHNAIPVGGGFDELTTLICLHGNGGSGRVFLELSRRLATSRSIYSPDLPGCGESDAPPAPLGIVGYADAIGDFLDSMRFRQIDLLGAGAGAAVAAELAIARPKVVRRICLLGSPGKEVAAATPGAQALREAGVSWQGDRRKLIQQPVLALDSEASMQTAADALAVQMIAFLAG